MDAPPPIRLFIDADACPVKAEAVRVATRYQVKTVLVSNQGMRPIPNPLVTHKVVGAGFDAADDWIVEEMHPCDVVVTGDIPLAARVIAKGGRALNANGQIFTPQNISGILALRDLNAYLREAGEIKGHNAAFSAKNRSDFLQSLDRLLQSRGVDFTKS